MPPPPRSYRITPRSDAGGGNPRGGSPVSLKASYERSKRSWGVRSSSVIKRHGRSVVVTRIDTPLPRMSLREDDDMEQELRFKRRSYRSLREARRSELDEIKRLVHQEKLDISTREEALRALVKDLGFKKMELEEAIKRESELKMKLSKEEQIEAAGEKELIAMRVDLGELIACNPHLERQFRNHFAVVKVANALKEVIESHTDPLTVFAGDGSSEAAFLLRIPLLSFVG